MAVQEHHALPRQRVQVRRPDEGLRIQIADIAVFEVVGHDGDQVRRLRRRDRRAKKAPEHEAIP